MGVATVEDDGGEIFSFGVFDYFDETWPEVVGLADEGQDGVNGKTTFSGTVQVVVAEIEEVAAVVTVDQPHLLGRLCRATADLTRHRVGGVAPILVSHGGIPLPWWWKEWRGGNERGEGEGMAKARGFLFHSSTPLDSVIGNDPFSCPVLDNEKLCNFVHIKNPYPYGYFWIKLSFWWQ